MHLNESGCPLLAKAVQRGALVPPALSGCQLWLSPAVRQVFDNPGRAPEHLTIIFGPFFSLHLSIPTQLRARGMPDSLHVAVPAAHGCSSPARCHRRGWVEGLSSSTALALTGDSWVHFGPSLAKLWHSCNCSGANILLLETVLGLPARKRGTSLPWHIYIYINKKQKQTYKKRLLAKIGVELKAI